MKTVFKQLIRRRQLVADVVAASIICAAVSASFLLRFEFAVQPADLPMLRTGLALALGIKLTIFRLCGLRQLAWRHLGFDDLLRITLTHVGASVTWTGAVLGVSGAAFPRSICVLDFVLCLGLEVATRAAIRLLFEVPSRRQTDRRRVLIFGAGKAGVQLLNDVRLHPELGLQVIGFLDDDVRKHGMRLQGSRVAGGRRELAEVAAQLGADEVWIALPAASGHDISEIVEQCHLAHLASRRVPALAELVEGKVLVEQIREVRIEDLLDRPAVRLDPAAVTRRLKGQVVLVTGAGGSIGSELCRQIARHEPAALIGFDQAETALFEIEQELNRSFPALRFFPEVGSVQNRQRLEEVFALHTPQAVYHAAAYKHVPLMEGHLFEAVKNNIFGTRNVLRAAEAWSARDFVMISSDKAVRPTNVMGATKRIAELVCQTELERGTRMKTVSVRFGNVLGSNGSVVPRFREQIGRGGPVTVTHPDIRRYFMTIPEAAQLVLQAGALGTGGEIFVLEMGEPVRILDLARKMILLSGLRPEVDIPIEFTGLRPGEKMYEELSAYEENTVATPHPKIRVFAGAPINRAGVERALEQLHHSVRMRDTAGILAAFEQVVPEYQPSNSVQAAAIRPQARSVVA